MNALYRATPLASYFLCLAVGVFPQFVQADESPLALH